MMFSDDLRHAFRRLRSKPALVIAAIAMLGLGIGITTAMFTVVDALLLRPVPFRDPERLAQIYMGSDRGGRTVVNPAVLREWRASPAFEGVEGVSIGTALLEANGTVVSRTKAIVSAGLFDMLGVRPIRGRLFDPSEGRAGTEDRVLISEDLWRSVYQGDAAIVGRRVIVDRLPMLVVGVLPAEFRFPEWDTQVWLPIDFEARPPAYAEILPRPYARFSSRMPQPEAMKIATETAHQADGATAKLRLIAYPLAGLRLDEYSRRAVPILAGGVALVFLVLCANVSSLLLGRLTARRREFSMCSALGATRGRLVRQAFLENVLLGAAGAAAGVVIGWLLVSTARSFLPQSFLLRTLNPLNIDMRALGVASIFGVLSALVAGLLPAWIGTRPDAASSLRVVDRGGTETRGSRALTRGLLIGEIALACTLLVGATLLVRSFIKLADADRGLDADRVLTAWVGLSQKQLGTDEARVIVARELEDQVRALPGVQKIAMSFGRPPDGGAVSFGDWYPDTPGAPPVNMDVQSYEVSADFFEFYGIALIRGRLFQPGDSSNDVVISERLASALWPGENPVGRSFTFGKTPLHAIGLVKEIYFPSLDARRDLPEFYRPFRAVGNSFMMSIRCAGACPPPPVVRQRLLSTSPAVTVNSLGLLEDSYFEELARPRAAAVLGFTFAVIALLAAAGGLFSVLAYAVSQRRREFGIRTALGASPGAIRSLVFRDGFTVALAGVAVGSLAAWFLARALASLQYGVTSSDPISWLFVIVLLVLTTLAAAWRPARQATRFDPVRLLRDE